MPHRWHRAIDSTSGGSTARTLGSWSSSGARRRDTQAFLAGLRDRWLRRRSSRRRARDRSRRRRPTHPAPAPRLIAVHDRELHHATELAADGEATVHRTLSALLRDPRVDVVCIALPHDLLAQSAVKVLRAGRHVVVEKPAATNGRGIRAIRDAAIRADRSVGVMFDLRHLPTVAAARRLVDTGALGRLRAVRIRTLIDKPADYWASGPTGAVLDPWRASRARAGGGVVLMNAIHQFDLVRAITGLEPLRVSGL